MAELKRRTRLPEIVRADVPKLRRAGKLWKACCPFHKETTPSFCVYDDGYKCFGCGAHGDAVSWLTEARSMTFLQAISALADRAGLALPEGVNRAAPPAQAAPLPPPQDYDRDGDPEADAGRDIVDSIEVARLMWKRGQDQPKWPVQTYLEARGVPRAVIERPGVLDDLLFCPRAPFAAWSRGAKVDRLPSGPAMVAVIRSPFASPEDLEEGYPASEDPRGWPIIGVHVSWLTADYTGNRKSRDRGSMRKMFGKVAGGCVVLGRFGWSTPIAVGEGIETVLSALDGLPEHVGLAALSLTNLSGSEMTDSRGAIPMWNLEPDMRGAALRFRHDAPVRILVDADMKPLRVRTDGTGTPIWPKVADAPRGRYVIREIGQAERAFMSAQLAVKGWQAMGSAQVTAARPPMGHDFNSAAKAEGVA